MATEVQMPKQGNSVEECLIIEWAFNEGDTVKEGDILCTIETDKATFEIEAPAAGTLIKQFVPAGELAPVLTNIAAIGNAGEDVSSLAPGGAEPCAPAQAPAATPTPAAAPVAMETNAIPVQMPKQGNSVEECLIVEWTVAEGDEVKLGDILCTIETDKATFEIEAPANGILLKQFVPAGDLAPVLTNIAAIGKAGDPVDCLAPNTSGAAVPAATEVTPSPVASANTALASSPTRAEGEFIRISPRARKLVEKLGIALAQIAGTGPNGRILEADVKLASESTGRLTPLAKRVAAATGMVAGTGFGPGGRVRARDLVKPSAATRPVDTADETPVEVPYIGIRKLIGDRMMQSLNNHAQLTLNSSADATSIMAFRKKLKANAEALGLPNITFNDMVACVVAWTLPKFPELNAIFQAKEGKVVRYKQVHLGMAVDTDRGLMVPVIRNAEQLTLGEMALSIRTMAGESRSGKIDPDLLSGGTFTITNLGTLGVESFTPVLNSPQVAILGICAITDKPVPDKEKGFRFQPTMSLSLTIDHQVVDGAPAGRFLQAVAKGIEDFEFIMASQAI